MVTSKRFRHKKTGEIKTQIPLLDISDYVEVPHEYIRHCSDCGSEVEIDKAGNCPNCGTYLKDNDEVIGMKWTKRLDKEMHISLEGQCLCGKACVGNNYADDFPDRQMCPECEMLMKCSKCGVELNHAELKENKDAEYTLCYPCMKGNN